MSQYPAKRESRASRIEFPSWSLGTSETIEDSLVHLKNFWEAKTMNDEIIAEVRAIKEAIGAKFNYDLRALFEEIKLGEAELQAKGIHLVPPPTDPTTLPGTALQRGKARGRFGIQH